MKLQVVDINGGGGRSRPAASGTYGGESFDCNLEHDGALVSGQETHEGEFVKCKSLVEEANNMWDVIRYGVLDRQMMQRFVLPVSAKVVEREPKSEGHFRNEPLYKTLFHLPVVMLLMNARKLESDNAKSQGTSMAAASSQQTTGTDTTSLIAGGATSVSTKIHSTRNTLANETNLQAAEKTQPTQKTTGNIQNLHNPVRKKQNITSYTLIQSPLPPEAPATHVDMEPIAKKERTRLEQLLRSKGMLYGSYPRFTVAVKGQKVAKPDAKLP